MPLAPFWVFNDSSRLCLSGTFMLSYPDTALLNPSAASWLPKETLLADCFTYYLLLRIETWILSSPLLLLVNLSGLSWPQTSWYSAL